MTIWGFLTRREHKRDFWDAENTLHLWPKFVTQGVTSLDLGFVLSGPSGLPLTKPDPTCHPTMLSEPKPLWICLGRTWTPEESGAATPAQ